MPKSLFVDPNLVRAPGKVTFNDIPVNQYNKTIAEELASGKYTKEDLVRIFRDMTILREFETMLNNIKTACGETDFLTHYKEYWDKISVESEKEWIRSKRESENNLVIACYIDGRPVGSCDITFFNNCKNFHKTHRNISYQMRLCYMCNNVFLLIHYH